MPTGKSVLLIDDGSRYRALMREVLAKVDPGGRFFAVENGELGIEHLERVAVGEVPSVDLVIVDRQMPRVDGFEVLASTRALPDVPMVMLTGSSDKEHIQRARNAGASDYLIKPPEEAGWEALGRELSVWTPGAARWGAKEIVRSPCAPGAVAMPRVDSTAVFMIQTPRSGDLKLVELSAACEYASITVRRALALHETDKILDAKRRLVVRYLMSLPLPWSDLEVQDFFAFGKRYLQERRSENARQPLSLCGSRALALE